jgi:hypothetical protein
LAVGEERPLRTYYLIFEPFVHFLLVVRQLLYNHSLAVQPQSAILVELLLLRATVE